MAAGPLRRRSGRRSDSSSASWCDAPERAGVRRRPRRVSSCRASPRPAATRSRPCPRRDPGTGGTLHLAHGDVATPAFVPLATRGSVKTLEPRDVEALGYEMVLGNTFHLFLSPGPELVGALRRAAPIHALGRGRSSPTPAASRSSRWATAAWPTRSRAAAATAVGTGAGRRGDPRDRGGGRALPLLRRRRRALHRPGDVDGGPGRARLRHRARVRRVHAVPRPPRLHGALDRAHPPLARALPALARRARAGRPGSSTGSSRAASTQDLRIESRRGRRRERLRRRSRSAARSGRTRRRCTRSSTGRTRRARAARARPAPPPARDRRRRRPDRAASSSGSTRSTARCRPGSAATAWRSCPTRRAAGASTSPRAAGASRRADPRRLPCPACARRLHARPTCTTCCEPAS